MLAILMLISFALGFIAGFGVPFLLFKVHGELQIDQSNPEKDKYLMVYYLPFETMKTKRYLRFKVNPDAKLDDPEP